VKEFLSVKAFLPLLPVTAGCSQRPSVVVANARYGNSDTKQGDVTDSHLVH
jgi:hypothetical protein